MIAGPLKIWFDGGCAPNPGPMRTCVFTRGKAWLRTDLGPGDNNDAEWLALVHALELARDLGATDVIALGDSALVVGQASGSAACRAPRFVARRDQVRALIAGFSRVRLRQVGRAQNLAGIALERERGRL